MRISDKWKNKMATEEKNMCRKTGKKKRKNTKKRKRKRDRRWMRRMRRRRDSDRKLVINDRP